MSDKLYYTPDKSEFCEGFEYEFKHPDSDAWVTYTTPEFNYEREDSFLRYSNFEGIFRVKRLTKEDFKFFKFFLWQIPGDSVEGEWNISLNDEPGTILEEDGVVVEVLIFGRIFKLKNKFELRRLLIQSQLIDE